MKSESNAAFKKRMSTITVPEGFTATFGEETWGWGANKITQLTFTLYKEDDTKIKFDQSGAGHTEFKSERGWGTYDRRGVEDSFHHIPYDFEKNQTPPDLNAIVAEQLARIVKSREYYKTAVAIPGLPGGFTVKPEGVAGLKKQLAAKNGHLTFTPSGFGTGYCITKKPTRGCRYGEERAKPELEAFLGQSPLYVHTLDCD
jgi:hypothetical protein